MIRIFVVDDSTFFRKALAKVLSADPMIQIIEAVPNEPGTVKKILASSPDLVTISIDTPGMEGLLTLKELRNKNLNLPVIVLSAVDKSKIGVDSILDILTTGAVDFIDKSTLNVMDFNQLSYELREKIRTWFPGKIKETFPPQKAALSQKNKAASVAPSKTPALVNIDWNDFKMCLVGASTGGPPAIQQILTQTPANFPIPILVVQHMPAGFVAPFAQRLNRLSALTVEEAKHGTRIEPGLALIAPAKKHLRITADFTTRLTTRPTDAKHIPSIDILMESAVSVAGANTCAILLTGMGNDGAKGMSAVHQQGGLTIAENEESCVVYGMPQAAYLSGAVSHLLPLGEIVELFRC